MHFDEVRTHGNGRKLGIVSYGNGVVTSLRARKTLAALLDWSEDDITVIDSPYAIYMAYK